MTSCFFNDGIFLSSFSQSSENDNFLTKDALLLVEGTHTDSAGVTHEFPKDRLVRIALNTNALLRNAVTLPFQLNHSRNVLDMIGEVISEIECRVLSEKDLPNPKQKHLIGKLGAFAKIGIKKFIPEVKKGLIKNLSPGVDLDRDCFIEVSAVSLPAIVGPALFAQSGTLSFKVAKEQTEESRRLKESLQEDFDIFWEVVRNIKAIDDNDPASFERDALLLKAIAEYTEGLTSQLEVKDEQEGILPQEKIYNSNPYSSDLVNQNNNFAQKSGITKFSRRRRR